MENEEILMKLPTFHHPKEIEELYMYFNDYGLKRVEQLLELPKETLTEDLKKGIEDSITRFGYFTELNLDGNGIGIVYHGLQILAEIAPESSQEILIKVFSQPKDYLDFYLDYEIVDLYTVCYKIVGNNLSLAKSYLLSPIITSFAKAAMVKGICAIAVHEPERRQEVLSFIDELLEVYITSTNEAVVDSSLNAMLLDEIKYANLHELAPYIQKLYKANRIDEEFCGSYNEYMKNSEGFCINNDNFKVKSLLDTYKAFEPNEPSTSRDDYTFEFDESYRKEFLSTEYDSIRTEPKVGRNDPCSCGSGKKYKKCCM
ncbi:DUF1186 domain-containing protein [Flammeovirga pectinis]|uniref:DUF1186 domain-containing protein n=1 Tax=Flammeovirga pectinis TaxID=2494373 RepID=A0A3S9P758_9BACT|nr:DUF1186 domain-containing protein [Flammeovirga pectinis]AZQ64040.1 DUF1186 domain-containing protein [Flammeovirga pectinis]